MQLDYQQMHEEKRGNLFPGKKAESSSLVSPLRGDADLSTDDNMAQVCYYSMFGKVDNIMKEKLAKILSILLVKSNVVYQICTLLLIVVLEGSLCCRSTKLKSFACNTKYDHRYCWLVGYKEGPR